MNTVTSHPEWDKRFIEVCVKALRKIHNEYQIWGYGRPGASKSSFKDYNVGMGLEFADERTVCASITQEALLSPLMLDHQRYYKVDRERKYEDGKRESVDLIVQRCRVTNGKIDKEYEENYIEAKRAQVFKPKLSDGTVTKQPPSINAVVEDIFKLSKFKKKYAYKYILVWGIHNKNAPTEKKLLSPNNFLKAVRKAYSKDKRFDSIKITLRTKSYFPLSWAGDRIDEMKVLKWGWVMLVEIDNPDH